MSETKSISYKPTDGLTYDPTEAKYWDPAMMEKEISRAFEICHGCRMCFKFCDSFPRLFSLLDDQYDGDVHKITRDDTKGVMDQCFQCKLCEVQCPYTPRDEHEFQLDFPKLVHRFQAIRARSEEASLRDKLLSDPDTTGKLARASFGLANQMNRAKMHRNFLHKAVGIHKDKLLPDFASQTFESWAKKNGRVQREPGAETVLFQTCYVQNNEPSIGRDVLEVYDHNQIDCAVAPGLRCCGMPAWERGDLEKLREHAHDNLKVLMPYVEAGAKVVVVNPTCSMMMRREYPELLEGDDRARAEKLAGAVQDTAEYLWSIRKEERFNTDFQSTPSGPVSCHAPCHLRAQAVGFRGRDLIRKIPGVKVSLTMECCGHDGTYAMKTESFEASKRIGEKSFDGMKESGAEVWSTECPLAAVQFEQHAQNRAMHPMTILAKAYRPDGFPVRVTQSDKEDTR